MKKYFNIILFTGILTILFAVSVPKVTHAAFFERPSFDSLVPCGNTSGTPEEMQPCQPCHFPILIQRGIEFSLYLATFFLILSLAVSGIMLAAASIDQRLIAKGKHLARISITGFLLCSGCYIIVNLVFWVSGAPEDISMATWGNFRCNAPQILPPSVPETKKLLALDVECEAGSTDTLVLATEATEDNPSAYTLKAVATFEYTDDSGMKTQGKEDVTQEANWTVADETIAKVNQGNVQAIGGGNTPVNVSYFPPAQQEKKTSGLDVYVNSCPTNQEKPSEGTCTACGKKTSGKCELVKGNADAEFIYIIARAESHGAPCDAPTPWKKNDLTQLSAFKNLVNQMSQGLNLLPSIGSTPLSLRFAMYRSDKIYPKEVENGGQAILLEECSSSIPNFQNVKAVMAGFVEHTDFPEKGGRAFSDTSISASAAYCDSMDAPMAGFLPMEVFAHEQIGHQFAGLDDEYFRSLTIWPFRDRKITQNCTADPDGKKWKHLGGGSYEECTVSKGLYSYSELSIMNHGSDFSDVQKAIIYSRVINFPNPRNSMDETIPDYMLPK